MCKQFHISNGCHDSVGRTAGVTPQCQYSQYISWYQGRHCSEEIQFLISKRLKVLPFSLEENPLLFCGVSLPRWDAAGHAHGTVIL